MTKRSRPRPRKCVVCGKILPPRNKSGLCSKDYNKEYVSNYNHQKTGILGRLAERPYPVKTKLKGKK